MRLRISSYFMALFKPSVFACALAIVQSPPVLAQADVESQGDEKFVVVKAGKIVTVSGEDIRNGVIVIVNGKIRAVGKGLDYPGNAKIIDASDMVVMPGMINPHTRIGLAPYIRTGVHGDLTVADEYFPDESLNEELLDFGYTTLGLYAGGRGVTGRGLVVRTGGDESLRVLLSPAHLWVTFDKKTFRAALKKAKAEIDKVEKARKEFEEKQKKAKQAGKKPPATQPASGKGAAPATQPTTQPTTQPAFTPPKIDPAHQVLVDLIQKKEGLFAFLETRRASDVIHWLDVLDDYEIAHKFQLRNFVQTDYDAVVEQLGEQEAQIVLLPYLNYVMYSAERMHLIKALSEAGCEVSLVPLFDSVREFGVMRKRLTDLVRDGWSREDALKSVTLNPARLLGLGDRFGSIEKGKEPDLIFLDGDPLDPFARVRKVMIGGRIIHTVEGDVK